MPSSYLFDYFDPMLQDKDKYRCFLSSFAGQGSIRPALPVK